LPPLLSSTDLNSRFQFFFSLASLASRGMPCEFSAWHGGLLSFFFFFFQARFRVVLVFFFFFFFFLDRFDKFLNAFPSPTGAAGKPPRECLFFFPTTSLPPPRYVPLLSASFFVSPFPISTSGRMLRRFLWWRSIWFRSLPTFSCLFSPIFFRYPCGAIYSNRVPVWFLPEGPLAWVLP